MKSPITGKEMPLCREKRRAEFRKESFEIVFHFYKCEDSGEQFTTTELDELNLAQLHNQYRYSNNIPFTDEIAKVRNKYQVSASSMSEILGLGVNTYRNYEVGEIPSKANAKLISLADNPNYFKELVKSCTTLKENDRKKILKRADTLINKNEEQFPTTAVLDYIFGSDNKGKLTGFKKPNAEKLAQMVLFFAERMKPYKTKMNKLLFYADFLNFRNSAFSISGMQYIAIDHGPVPDNFQSIFEYLSNEGYIKREIQHFPSGKEGTIFATSDKHKFDASLFTDAEMEILNGVANKFKDISASDIKEISHLEQGWIKNENNKSAINYEYAFDMDGQAIHR
ncbi:type II TA system antitoxin MqsA family protein [Proteiniphilum sp.]|uniref:type II TA system antitoxin MqsA family protein n=1 Tax=Proteiniphilum sp. TaxID=1926877 RepID=UPI00332739F0